MQGGWIRRSLLAGAMAAAATLASVPAFAQAWPSRPVRIVIGFGPGSGTDILARLVAEEFNKAFGQPFIVDNRPGASAQIAATHVARSDPDGYTLFLTSNSSHSVNPHIFKKLTYDPIADFTPLGGIAYFPFVLAIDARLPPKTATEFVAWSKENAGKTSYAYGTPAVQIPAAALDRLLGLGAMAVPYRSSPPAMQDVIGGRVNWLVVDLASSQSQIKAGVLRALAVTTSKRTSLAPELPTVEETLGLKGFDLAAWTGLFGPANLPPEIAGRLSATLQEVLARPAIREKLVALGAEPTPSDPKDFAALVRRQLQLWGEKVKDAGIQAE